MTPARWQQVKEILHGALQKEPGERSAFLGQACQTDPSLRLEVESLLDSAPDVTEDFLKSAPPDRVLLLKGTHLGSYEILNLLAVGGMGEVYRAYDPRLAREVAVKVLPCAFANDPDRLRRFEQEARAAAALNHPNILAIYDIGSTDQAIPYVVSELLEGETLRECLRRGPLAIRKSVDLMLQIASGLAAAHEKGIIHRDLKPENLFLTTDGRLKVFDFGLAKAIKGPGSHSVNSPRFTGHTEAGVVMGTAAYMSPEQARSQPADQRSDIFALGAIFYEMLSGKRAFQGETSADTMSAILSQEPPAVSQVVPAVPRALGQLVHRCLEKNAANRCQSATELISALEECAPALAARRSLSLSRRWRWYAMVIALVARSAEAPTARKAEGRSVRGLRSWVSGVAVAVLAIVLAGAATFIIAGRFRVTSNRVMLAVLPFENLSGDPE